MNKSTSKKLAQAASATWQVKRIAAARRARHHVKAQGVEYRSVRQAFEQLGLPTEKAKTFRQKLVAQQRASFEQVQFRLMT